MKVEIEYQYDKCGGKYLNQAQEMIEIESGADNVLIEIDGRMYMFPKRLLSMYIN